MIEQCEAGKKATLTYSHATVCLMCMCVCNLDSIWLLHCGAYLQVFLVGLTCRWGNKLFGVFSGYHS